uniref:Uncharacterized protein n=1 Tax=Lepeophtheirus salmonis TaxID=72036 RepID=A0A0K2UHK8_LEPSM
MGKSPCYITFSRGSSAPTRNSIYIVGYISQSLCKNLLCLHISKNIYL